MTEEEQNLILIIQAYEKGLSGEINPDNFKLLLSKSVGDLSYLTTTTRKTAEKYPGTKHAKSKTSSKRTKKESTISVEVDSDHKQEGIRPLDLFGDTGSDFGDYLEKCFGCDTRLAFEFQFLPPELDFLNPLNDLLKEVEALLDQLTAEYTSDKAVNELCATIDMFNSVPCPQDIINLIMSIQMLLVNYISSSLQLRLDWFSLLGPVLQAIGQILSLLVNFIFDFLKSPLQCTQASMIASLDVLRALDPNSFTTKLNKAKTNNESKLQLEASSVSSKLVSQDNYVQDIFSGTDSIIDVNHKNVPITDYTNTLASNISTGNILGESPNKELLIPTGMLATVKLSDLMNFAEFNSNFYDLSAPERLIATLNEALFNINNLKTKMDKTISSLINLVRGNKLLEIKSLSMIIYLLNLLSLLNILANTDWKNICKDKKNKKVLEETIRKITNSSSAKVVQTNDKATVEIVNLDGTTKSIGLNTCSMAKNSVTIPALDAVLKDIERITNGL